VARTVKLVVATVSGVPLTRPVGTSVRPAGSTPVATDQVYGALPPAAASCVETGRPMTAAIDVVVTVGWTTAGGSGGTGGAGTGAVTTSRKDVLRPAATVVLKALLTRSLYEPTARVLLNE
jgi:hypothetical protein